MNCPLQKFIVSKIVIYSNTDEFQRLIVMHQLRFETIQQQLHIKMIKRWFGEAVRLIEKDFPWGRQEIREETQLGTIVLGLCRL